jgi:hypothetical protein
MDPIYANLPIKFRPGTQADTEAVFNVFYNSLADLDRRQGSATEAELQEPGRKERWWDTWRPIFEHLAQTAERFWVAEREGLPVGYARSILRGGSRELTEFFVQPGEQSAGLGGELLKRAFPADGAGHRSILATVDTRALALYLKQGVYPRSPVYTFYRAPQPRAFVSDLAIQLMDEIPQAQAWIDALDDQIVGYRRAEDHAWLRSQRRGFFYLRGGRPAGYAYAGWWSGPAAVLEAGDLPAVTAHLETEANRQGVEEFGLDVPLVNAAAVDALLRRGFKIGTFQVLLMTDQEGIRLKNYIISSPEFFL